VPPDADTPPFEPDAASHLVDPGWWLELRCACGRTAQAPRRLLARAHGPRARVPGLLARFRCRTCGGPPVSAERIDDPAGGAPGSGYPPNRRVPLRLPPLPPPPGGAAGGGA